jgi:hypothetical protein
MPMSPSAKINGGLASRRPIGSNWPRLAAEIRFV